MNSGGNAENKRKMCFTICKSISRSFELLTKCSKIYLPISILYKAIQGFLPLIYVLIMQKMINLIQIGEGDYKSILVYIVCYVGIHIGNETLVLMYEKYNQRFSLIFSKEVNIKMMKKSMKLSLSDFEDSKTYDIINRAQSQKGINIIYYIHSVFEIFQLIISIISMIYLLLNFDWRITVVIVIIPIAKCIITYFIDKELYKERMDRTPLERQKWYINFLIMTGNAYKEIKILGIGSFLLKKYEDIQERINIEENRTYMKRTKINICLGIVDWIITGGIYLYIFILGVTGDILLGDVTAYIECTESIKGSVAGIFGGINELVDQSMYIYSLFEYFDLKEVPETNKKDIQTIKCIEFKDVSFKYNNGKYALKNASFRVEEGELVVLVGENGSGKTTLSKLLLGLYNDYEGDILVDGINLKEINLKSYQMKIGTVFQDYIKYEATIRENIAYGNLEHLNNDEEIYRVLKDVNLDDRINREEGLDTVVGNWFGGQQCSIGEWQRLAIARALIRNADVYIFDEPDAALDVLKQREILDLFKKVMNGKIGFYITHKINIVNELADVIMVIRNGVIEESGTHNELLEKKGHYFNLYTEAIKF